MRSGRSDPRGLELTAGRYRVNDEAPLVGALRGQAGVEQVVPFGGTIHVSGREAAVLEATLARLCARSQEFARTASGLEDVFIGLMDRAKDNFG